MVLRVAVANVTPREFAERIQAAELSASVFESLGAGAWGVEPGATAEFAVTRDQAHGVYAFIRALLAERNEQAAYVTRADDRGTVARLHGNQRPQHIRCRYCGAYVGPRGGCPVNRKDCGR